MGKLLIEKFIAGDPIDVSKLTYQDRCSLTYDLCVLQAGQERRNIAKAAGESKSVFEQRIAVMLKRLQAGK
ncbi:MAG TPA: hypothetical protein VNV63_05885 [Nitrospiria bacterium]|jgi:hypothetical protein|nr:hypothetical protein [Nitrospiria bacterium]